MMLPKILIYKERFSLDDFRVYEDGFNKNLFGVVSKFSNVVSDAVGDLEGQYLSIFNAAYYICADAMRSKLPFLKMKEYREYARFQTQGSLHNADAVLCMVSVILSDYPFPDNADDGLREAIRKEVDSTFYADFFRSWDACSSKGDSRLWERYAMKPDAFTEDFCMQNLGGLEWKKWTNWYSEREVREIVCRTGDLKEEKLNLLDAIIADAQANGCKDADRRFSHFRAELEWGMEDSPFGYVYRKNHVSVRSEPALPEEDTSAERIRELEAEAESLRARVKELEDANQALVEDCRRKANRIHDMEIMVSVFERMVPQITINNNNVGSLQTDTLKAENIYDVHNNQDVKL